MAKLVSRSVECLAVSECGVEVQSEYMQEKFKEVEYAERKHVVEDEEEKQKGKKFDHD